MFQLLARGLRVALVLILVLLITGPALAAGYPRRIALAPFVSLAKEDIGSTVAVLPRLMASRLMALAGADVLVLPAGGKSPQDAAREAKYPLLLQGTVSKLGKGYSIDAVVTDLADGKNAGAFFVAAATEDDIIAQVGILSGEVAEKIFGVQGAVRAVSPAPVVAAPVVAAPIVAPLPAPSAGGVSGAAPAGQAQPAAVASAPGADHACRRMDPVLRQEGGPVRQDPRRGVGRRHPAGGRRRERPRGGLRENRHLPVPGEGQRNPSVHKHPQVPGSPYPFGGRHRPRRGRREGDPRNRPPRGVGPVVHPQEEGGRVRGGGGKVSATTWSPSRTGRGSRRWSGSTRGSILRSRGRSSPCAGTGSSSPPERRSPTTRRSLRFGRARSGFPRPGSGRSGG